MTATDAALIALGERFEKLLLEHDRPLGTHRRRPFF
jgi:hypothetical protein